MIAFIKDWIMNIAALVIFLVLIEIMMPSGRMKKYCELVTGVILIISIISPFLKLYNENLRLEDIQIASSNTLDRLEIEKNSKLLKEDQMKQIVEVYRKKIIRQMEDSAMRNEEISDARGDVIINEDYESESFGEIKQAYLEITLKTGDSEGIKPVTRVRQVKIGEDNKTEGNGESIDPGLKKKLEDTIIGMFALDRENIVISRTE